MVEIILCWPAYLCSRFRPTRVRFRLRIMFWPTKHFDWVYVFIGLIFLKRRFAGNWTAETDIPFLLGICPAWWLSPLRRGCYITADSGSCFRRRSSYVRCHFYEFHYIEIINFKLYIIFFDWIKASIVDDRWEGGRMLCKPRNLKNCFVVKTEYGVVTIVIIILVSIFVWYFATLYVFYVFEMSHVLLSHWVRNITRHEANF